MCIFVLCPKCTINNDLLIRTCFRNNSEKFYRKNLIIPELAYMRQLDNNPFLYPV